MTTESEIKRIIVQILTKEPGLVCKEIARRVREISGDSSIRKKHCNPILYRDSTLFRYEGVAAAGEPPPRWYLREDISPITPDRKKPKKKPLKKKIAPKKKASNKQREKPKAIKVPKLSKQLYTWQKKAIEKWNKACCSGVVEAVTGTGKTFVGIWLMHKYIQEQKRCLVIVPTQVLLRQWKEEIETELGFELTSLVGAGYQQLDLHQPITLGVVNSVVKLQQTGQIDDEFDLIIADECHRYGSKRNKLALLKKTKDRLGLTATFERSDDFVDEVLIPYFKKVCFKYQFKQARKDGVIARFISLSIGTNLTVDDRETFDSCGKAMRQARDKLIQEHGYPAEFKKFLTRVQRSKNIVEGVLCQKFFGSMQLRRKILSESPLKISVLQKIQDIIKSSWGTLVYCESIESAEIIAGILRKFDFETEPYHSKLKEREKEEIFTRFRNGDTKCIVAVRTLDEGVNVPEANCAIIVAASKQRRQMIQRMGRILRKKHDGTGSVFIHIYARNTGEDPSDDSSSDEYYLSVLRKEAESRKIVDSEKLDCSEISQWIYKNQIWLSE